MQRKVKEIQVKIKGVTPLICNRFTEEEAMNATKGRRSSAGAKDSGTEREIAEKKLYRGVDNKTLIVPQPNVMRCIAEGGRFHKIGKKQVTTQRESLMYACLDIPCAEIPIKHKQPWHVDTRPIVNPQTQGRRLAHRPMFDDWELSFTLLLDSDIMHQDLLRAIVDDAGYRVGLGDFRPARSGPYGRFNVTLWK